MMGNETTVMPTESMENETLSTLATDSIETTEIPTYGLELGEDTSTDYVSKEDDGTEARRRKRQVNDDDEDMSESSGSGSDKDVELTVVGEADLVKIKKEVEEEEAKRKEMMASSGESSGTKDIEIVEDEEGSGEFEDNGSGDGSGDEKEMPELNIVTIEKDGAKKCKPRPKASCHETEFGCCLDGKVPARGPFKEGCEIFESCEDTEFGCCPDDISPAQGPKFLGCLGVAICDSYLFGCCSDNFTAAVGSEGEGCDNLIEFHCKETTFGCCPDESTPATGKNNAGCLQPKAECLGSGSGSGSGDGSGECDCEETTYGCCPDGTTPAMGEDFEGCLDGSGSGDGLMETTTAEILADCERSPFGCCNDSFTAAHGENYEGCCLASPFGCCPDHISTSKGPNFEGCGCEFSAFGCCPDNETLARGPDNAGCGCEYTEFGCCPDNHTPSVGVNQTGCACNTYEFGCCPDGISISKGPNKEECGCSHAEFGCCDDGRTLAKGPENEGCGCEASEFGCCGDGVTPAGGKLFEGCQEEVPIVPGEVCGFGKDRGPCRNFTVKFYFDMNYGGCTRFWYGGCEGNLNRFMTEEECESTCVTPEGLDACRLPSVAGPCTGSQPSWYHDSETESCRPFEYRGCLGNKNRFASKEECEEICVIPEKTDVCLLEVRPGPCRGNYTRWHYDQTVDQCESFTFGGCKGNGNNFLSDTECMQRCIRGRSQDICTLPKSSGLCEDTLPRWYFDYTEARCMPFYYTGCDGNANRFDSRGECEATCSQRDADPCSLPQSVGNCTDFVEKYFYDFKTGNCKQFVYGGCRGNENNYDSMEECSLTCEKEKIGTDTAEFSTESCFLPSDQGTCSDFTALWYYDSNDGACKQFLYSGCAGNANRFRSRQDCEYQCGEVQDICQLPRVVGPCKGSLKQYYYDYARDECLAFDYGGCLSNKNRFDSRHLCQQRCQAGRATTPVYPPDEDRPSFCSSPMYTGQCRAAMPSWYYDPAHSRCIGFTYGGCSGNANRFQSLELCERQCGKFRQHDVCNQQVDPGSCEGTLTKWYHDPFDRACKYFYFTGCEGNGNRFSSQSECEAECIYIDTIFPQGNSSSQANTAICELEKDSGPCNDGYKRWFFNVETGSCEGFVYGGCGGNQNKFKNFNHCSQFCYEASLIHRPQVSTERSSTASPYDPCLNQNLYCTNIKCQYGITRRMDNYDCESCECFDPCENMICFRGSECSVELIQSRTETYEEVRFEAVCREVSKAGTCPPLSGEIYKCDQECESDAMCSGTQKCCYNGCAYICIDPQRDPGPLQATERPYGTPAVITFADTKVTVQVNDMANLVCQADGIPTPAVAWFKDGNRIEISADGRFQLSLDYSLRIMNVDEPDRGLYTCVANNGLGSPAEREVELEVLDPTPRAVDIVPPQEPSPVVTLGSPIVLRCWASGWPKPVFSWWRGETMMPRTSEKYEALPLGGLRIKIVTLRDLGPYTCQAYNGEGRPATNTFILRALGPVNAVSAQAKNFLQFIVNPPKIPTFAPPIITTSDFPVIKPEERPYWPTYHTPPVRTTETPETGHLRAFIRSNITKFTPFSDIVLPCEVEGYPPPTVQWYHNNVPLHNTERIEISVDNNLRIKNAEEIDAGTYKCEVRNLYGEANHSTTISVQGVYVHPSCTDNPFFANCKLIVKAQYCTNTYYARFCCRSCTIAGQLPSFGPHLQEKARRSKKKK